MSSAVEIDAFLSVMLRRVASECGTTPEMVRGVRKDPAARRARLRAVDEMRAFGASTLEIGRAIGRDHTTVLYYLGRLPGKLPPRAA